MNITEAQRADIETALDELLMLGIKDPQVCTREEASALRAYHRAIAVVRDRPPGVRKLRSDAGLRGTRRQQEMPV